MKRILLGSSVVLLCAGLPAWLVWTRDVTPVETVAKDQASFQQQINDLRAEVKARGMKDESEWESLRKETNDLRKRLAIQQKILIQSKGNVLNADQDIHKFVTEALKEEPTRDILSTPDLIERARKIGLTTLKVQK